MVNLPAIPAGWEQVGTAAMSGTRTAQVRYWTGPAPDAPDHVYDPALRVERPNRGTVAHTGMARIQQHDTPLEELAGDQQVTTHRYLIAAPRDWDQVTLRGWVEVLDSTDHQLNDSTDHQLNDSTDHQLNDSTDHQLNQLRWLRVIDIQHGSLRFERDLICTTNLQ